MLDISTILKNIGTRQELNMELDIKELNLNYDIIKLSEKISFKGNARNIDNIIYIQGIIDVSFPIQCYSCGKEFIFNSNIEIEEKFLKSSYEEEYIIEDNKIDIEKAVIDNLILKLPSKFLCNENCKGICNICMKDRNYVKCNCNNLKTDPRFDKLKQLLK